LVDVGANSRPYYSLVSLCVIREMSSKYGFRLFRAAAKLLPENNAYLGYIFQEEFRQRMKKYKSVTLSLSECVKQHAWMKYEVCSSTESRIYECGQIIEFYSEEEIEALEGNILEKTFFDLKINQAGFDYALLNLMDLKISYHMSHNGMASLLCVFVYELLDYLFEKNSLDIGHKRKVSVSSEFDCEYSIELRFEIFLYTFHICVF
jgi:hypothetical protein